MSGERRDRADEHAFALEAERYELFEGPRYRFDLPRRRFMGIFAAMGGGLLVLASRGHTAQQPGRGAGGTQQGDLNAWIHVDRSGAITAFTGKTEIGQNIRTSLTQTMADELGVAPEAVTLVMADTDLTPYDAGTFGSQTTPRMAPQLARAAATARELLIAHAARTWSAAAEGLRVRNGAVAGPAGRTMGYGELAGHLDGTVAAPALTDAGAWVHRGKPLKKVNGRSFVTGAHRYAPDIVRPGMRYGRVIRPEGYTGALVSLDTAAATAIDGVRAVRDGDFAGLVAPDERTLARAAAAVRGEWRVPADEPDSRTVYAHLKRSPARAGGRGSSPTIRGDVAQARTGAARTFDASYRIPYIAHVPLEPRAAVAEWTDGKLTVWCGTQRPFGVRAELASAFHLPVERVRVIVPDTGSAYGGKHTGEHAVEAARLARAAGAPVKLVWTRAEEFSWGYFRPAGVIDVKAAVDGEGRLIAWEFDNWNSGGSAIQTPYGIPNQRIQFHPAASPLRQGSYRGLAATANHYAREMHMDAIARGLGVDAVEFRLRHLDDPRMRAVLSAAAERAGWSRALRPAGRAMGISCGTEKGSYVATAAEVTRTPDGFRVEKLTVAFECGAVVNPDGLHSQVEGAVVQGLGGALFEAVEFRDGRIVNGTMAAYRVPRFRDIPAIDIVVLDRTDLPSAGAGETPIVCVAPAIGSAVRAFGEVDTALPVRLL